MRKTIAERARERQRESKSERERERERERESARERAGLTDGSQMWMSALSKRNYSKV